MGISIKNFTTFYAKEKSLNLKEYENNYDLDLPWGKEKLSTANTILNLVREIAYSRAHNRPSTQKIKTLRKYRDYDLPDK